MIASSSGRHNRTEFGASAQRSHTLPFRGRETSNITLLRDFFGLHYAGITTAAEVLADMLFLGLAFALAYLLCPLLPAASRPPVGVWIEISLLAMAAGVLIFQRNGLYRRQVSLMNVDATRKIFHAVSALTLLLYAYAFFTEAPVSPFVLLAAAGAALLLVSAERMGFYKLHQVLHLRGYNVNKVLIYGAGEVARQLFQKICQSPKLGYFALGFFDEEPALLDAARRRVAEEYRAGRLFLSKKEELLRAILSGSVDEVFIARPSLPPEALQEVVGLCRKYGVRFRYIPYLYGYFVEQIQMTEIDGIPLVAAGEIPVSGAGSIGKRVFDRAASLGLLLLLSPLLLLIGMIIRLDSPGPAVFRQTRVGKNGTKFRIFKFRSMYADIPVYQRSPDSPKDERITPVGRFLRRTSLDELPQLINVLRGEMSLVGPRPEMPFIVEQYNELQRERLRVRPGITGLWQISADRRQAIHENMAYDLYYIRNRSLLLDAAILVRTVLFAMLSMRTC